MSYTLARSPEPLRLSAFSREVLEAVCSWLEAPAVFLLYATGDTNLRYKLVASVRHFNLQYTRATARVWPKALSYFPHLQEIALLCRLSENHVLGVDFSLLPPSTKRLSVSIVDREWAHHRCRFPPPQSSSSVGHPFELDFATVLPNLEHLSLTEDLTAAQWEKFSAAAKTLPLMSLRVPSISTDHIALLPPTLTSLSCSYLLSSSPLELSFPPFLETLEILLSTTVVRSPAILKSLPTTLKKLLLCSDITAAEIRTLPRSLTHLDLVPSFSLVDPNDALFPPNLTFLSLRAGSMSRAALALVPKTLKTLIVNLIYEETLPMPPLPPVLTEMSRLVSFETPALLPSTLKRILTWSSIRDVEPTVCNAYYNTEKLELMPALPRSLEELTIHGHRCLVSPHFVLPPAITRLSLLLYTNPELTDMDQLFKVIGEQLPTLKFLELENPIDMRSLHHLRVPLTSLRFRLPTKFITLALPIFRERSGDSNPIPPLSPKQFPHAHKWWSELISLDIVSNELITPQWIATLPKTLKTLHIQDLNVKHVSGKVLRFLPPKLESLQFYLSDIGPGDLCSLPKSLQMLLLRCDDSKATFPRSDLLTLPYGLNSAYIPHMPTTSDPFMNEIRKTHMFL